ncbi:MAG: hypothetical protein NTY64_01480 [Deltaproteobacteria bacterium]|nr:hypothetical protein [Deltaproteobacteria bacterium]
MMVGKQFISQLLLLAFFLALSSCTLRYAPPQTAEDFSQETTRPEKRISDPDDPSIRAKAHLQLAWLYLDHRNPKVDYGRALKEFEAYLLLAPEGEKNEEIQNWLSILRELEAQNRQNMKLQEQILAATKEMGEGRGMLERQVTMNKKLKEDLQKLQENNLRLKETIKKLKTLDRQMEERRRSIQ